MSSLKIGCLNPLDVKCLVEVNKSKRIDFDEADTKKGVTISDTGLTFFIVRVRTKHIAGTAKATLGERVLSGIISLIDSYASTSQNFTQIPFEYNNLYKIDNLSEDAKILIQLHSDKEDPSNYTLSVKGTNCEIRLIHQELSINFIKLKQMKKREFAISIVCIGIILLFLSSLSIATGNIAITLITLGMVLLSIIILLHWRGKWRRMMKNLLDKYPR